MEMKKILYKIMLIFIIISLLLQLSVNYIVYAIDGAFVDDNPLRTPTEKTILTVDDCPYDIEFIKIDSEWYVSMGIDSSGYLWGWGNSNHEIFGEEGVTASIAPRRITDGMIGFKDVAVSDTHVLALDLAGNLYTWGNNDHGQLGNGGTTKVVSPRQIMSGTKFSQIAVTRSGSMAIDTYGNLWAWGSYTSRLGLGNITEDVLTPQKVSESIKFSKISMGGVHSIAIDRDGKLYSWGNNTDGQLGNGGIGSSQPEVDVPVQIMTGQTFKEIAVGTLYSMAIDTDGNIWTWGINDNGQLGDGTTTSTGTPKQITTGKIFNKIEAGQGGRTNQGASFAIDNEGKLWSWGTNDTWWLCNGGKENTLQPTKVMESMNFKEISSGQYYAIGIDTNNDSWSWGIYLGAKGTGLSAPQNQAIRFTGDDYIVTFKDGENIVKTESVKFNKPATAPTLTKDGYILSWDTTFSNVMEDLTVNAVWTKIEDSSYTVEHYKQNLLTNTYDKVESDTENLTGAPGSTVTATPKRYEGYTENQTHADRIASGEIKADGSLVLKLYYDVNEYTVTFKDGDTVLSSQTVKHGQAATAPTPTKEGHTFVDWDRTFTNVTSDLTVSANWRINTYKVILNTNGGVIAQESELTSYTYGIGATLPTPTKTGYIFAGWYNNAEFTGETIANIGTKAVGDRTYFAKWTQNQLTVTFKDGETVLKTQNVGYGEAATAPTLTKEGYVLRWDKQYNNITTDLTVNAIWLVDTDKDGIPDIEEPKQVTYKVEHYIQTKNGYELKETEELTAKVGEEVSAVEKGYASHIVNKQVEGTLQTGTVVENGELVLKLYYDHKQFTVTFKDGDKVVKTQTVIYGENAIPPVLTKQGYILSWDKKTDNITQNETLVAVWTKDPNYVDPNDGKEETPSKLPQTGESYIIAGTISVLISIAVFIYLKYRKIDNI